MPWGEILEDQLVRALAGCSEQADEEDQEENKGFPHSGTRVASTRGGGSRAKYLILRADGIMTRHTSL